MTATEPGILLQPATTQDAFIEQALAAMVQESHAHLAVNHPFLQRFASGDFADQQQALRTYAREYSGYSAWFPHYLRAVISRLPSPAHRELLQHNLDEEQGLMSPEDCETLRAAGIDPNRVQGIPHSQLFRSFCRSVGLADAELANPTPAAARWRTRFLTYLQNATPAEAVGALGFGTEQIVRPIYKQLLQGILGLGTLRRSEFVFFELHYLVDDQHQQDLANIATELALAPGGLDQLRCGMRHAMQLRVEFWDHLLQAVIVQENAS